MAAAMIQFEAWEKDNGRGILGIGQGKGQKCLKTPTRASNRQQDDQIGRLLLTRRRIHGARRIRWARELGSLKYLSLLSLSREFPIFLLVSLDISIQEKNKKLH